MATRYLYTLPLPEEALDQPRGQQRQRVDSQGALGSDVAATKAIAAEAGQLIIRGVTAGQYADLTAAEFEELFGAVALGPVPFAKTEGADPQLDGYYQLEDVELRRGASQDPRLQQYDGVLTPAGTRQSHWRSVATNPDPVDNPFGGGSAVEIGLHADAEKVRWFDDRGGTGAVEDATVQRTVAGERCDIDIYDATEPSFDQPTLIYTVGYTEEYQADAVLWDDYDREKLQPQNGGSDGSEIGSATIGEATIGSEYDGQVVSWGRVYSTGHDFVGQPVAETGRLRLRFDEDRGRIKAYRWNDADGQYDAVQLGLTDWRLFDADVTHIGLARVELQVEFEDTSAGSLTTHNLNCSLKRGHEDALWTVPPNGSSPPQGLVDRLDPIASTQGSDPSAGTELVERSQVNQ